MLHGLVQVLQALVNHGLRVQLQIAAGLKVHANQRLIQFRDTLGDVRYLRVDAAQQSRNALLGGLVQVFLKL
ncbi:hypothetical protein SDC9_182006 [bioreactor metagenome]|uniref:Uncharacterized protein n=1 Tax=bioreactor metagenome TaxID=1076179 RepID=A0A645H819_9ZZZZ